MGCCNNKNPCSNKREEFNVFNDAALPLINSLLDIAKTGVPTLFKNEAADQLAAKIADLVAENKYLRTFVALGLAGRTDISVAADTLKIAFGPAKEYQLLIPVAGDRERRQLIESLTKAAADLTQTQESKQLPLF